MAYYAVNTQSNYLAHHGILGQKWGIRRFQNPDGSLTLAGRERYGSLENFKKSDYYKKYQAKEYAKQNRNPDGSPKTKQQLEIERRKKIARNVAIGAAVAAAVVAGGYAYYKWRGENKDLIIKGGEALQRISKNDETSLFNEFFASFDKKDNERYKNMLPAHYDRFEKGGEHLIKQLKATSDIKVASRGTGRKIFDKLKEADSSFAKAFDKGKDGYYQFNASLVGKDGHNSENARKFYDAVKKAGYDAIIDVNDSVGGGFQAKSPAIIINKGKVAIENISKIGSTPAANLLKAQKEGVNIARDYQLRNVVVPELIETVAGYSGAVSAGSGIGYGILSKKGKVLEETQLKKNQKK